MTQIYQVECNDALNINEWLRELSAQKQDDDQWYTLYESKV